MNINGKLLMPLINLKFYLYRLFYVLEPQGLQFLMKRVNAMAIKLKESSFGRKKKVK